MEIRSRCSVEVAALCVCARGGGSFVISTFLSVWRQSLETLINLNRSETLINLNRSETLINLNRSDSEEYDFYA